MTRPAELGCGHLENVEMQMGKTFAPPLLCYPAWVHSSDIIPFEHHGLGLLLFLT